MKTGILVAILSAVGALADTARFSLVERSADEEDVAKPQYRVVNEKAKSGQTGGATVVSVFAGEKNTGGYAINVSAVDRDRKNVCRVQYKVASPARDAMVTQALTYPAVTIRIEPACKSVQVVPPVPLVKK